MKTGGPVARVYKKTKRMFRLPTNSASSIISIKDGKLINALELSISRARLSSALEQPRVKAFASLAVRLLTLLIVNADYNVGDNKTR